MTCGNVTHSALPAGNLTYYYDHLLSQVLPFVSQVYLLEILLRVEGFGVLSSANFTRSPTYRWALSCLSVCLSSYRFSALRLQFRKITSFQTKPELKAFPFDCSAHFQILLTDFGPELHTTYFKSQFPRISSSFIRPR